MTTKSEKPGIMLGIVGALLVLGPVMITAGLLLAFTNPAWPHDALPTAAKPQGWSYPFSCCSGYDCREVGTPHQSAGSEGVQVSEKPEGYVISSTHEVIAYGDARLKDSPDGQFHWCSVAGSVVGRTICLFVPPRSY